MNTNYLEAILQKLIGEKAIQTQDLAVYLTNPVAIGEHPHIGEEVENKIAKIDELESRIDTIQKLKSQLYANEANTTAN